VCLAVLVFVYCSIGSAMPQVRQLPALEMTEFEWFHWWPFNLLVLLFATTMAVVTVRRIPLRKVNGGVWMIHSGIVVLVLGSYVYFTTKVEGDAPVFRRQIRIELPGMSQPARLVALPGSEISVTAGPDRWRFQIQSTNSSWPILSEPHVGEHAHAVNVMVAPPAGEAFVRQLLAGYPEYTEDVIPGKGRAIKHLGTRLVDERLRLTLEFEPQTYFHVQDTWALYVRQVGEATWAQRPIEGMPRYNDHVGSRDQVFTDPHYPVTPRMLEVSVPPAEGGDALSGTAVRVTGYVRYARMSRQWRNTAAQLNPVVQGALVSPQSRDERFELAALEPQHNTAAEGNIRFIWLDDAARISELPNGSQARLRLEVPAANVSKELVLNADTVVGPEGAMTPIEGTDYSYRIRGVQNDLVIPSRAGRVSVALVEIHTPEGQFTRWVADRPEFTRDMKAEGDDPHGQPSPDLDARIAMTYHPGSAPVVFVGHPGGLQFVLHGPSGMMMNRPVRPGETVELMSGVGVRVDGYWPNAESEVKPRVVPPPERERDAGEMFSMIRLEVDTGQGVQTRWLQFTQYAFPSSDYAYAGRFAYLPEQFRGPDGRVVEVMFSRQRRELPSPIALEDFELDTHLGGYTGSTATIRNYVSRLRFNEHGTWTEPVSIAVNHPAEHGGLWYFQSTWDKPPSSMPGGGMNYTGLGVGNRHGVYVQLAGCCLAVAGMIFAFYVKPVLKRRRAEASRVRVGRSAEWPTDSPIATDAAPVRA